MKRVARTFSGSRSNRVSVREIENRKVARKAAAQGIVLLKNEGVLPLKRGCKIASFGGGTAKTIKGGTGSGDVNEREVVSIYQGLVKAGFDVVNKDWIENYFEIYTRSRLEWRDMIKAKAAEEKNKKFFDVYAKYPYEMPTGRPITQQDINGAKNIIYVISRVAGEAADRYDKRGDYYLTEKEKEELHYLAERCDALIVILNTGGQIDLNEILEIDKVKALLTISQPGMEAGNAVADVLTGAVTPGGKLTGTWTKKYEDFPNSATFSHNNGDVMSEKYEESIYVGYRYFDSFGVDVVYPFGYGLSYTDFSIKTESVSANGQSVTVKVKVENTGSVYSGREVVQIYAACPQNGLKKEYKRLCAFAKTQLLPPGAEQTLEISFPIKGLASFDESRGAWVVEAGQYGIMVGNSSASVTVEGVLEVKETVSIEVVKHICPLKEELKEIVRPEELAVKMEAAWKREAEEKGLIPVVFVPDKVSSHRIPANELDAMAAALVEKLSDDELIAMTIGEVSKGQGNTLGCAGIAVPGAAGETSGALEEKWDVPGISMADGPAGVRLHKKYQVNPETNSIYAQGMYGALEGGLFAETKEYEGAETYYQYCTAIPVGTSLAQTWDTELIEEVGAAIGIELQEFGIAWWLAPGMNIHRNPLCGRNFEYYSEDPVVSGVIAAAMTRGVQSAAGVGTTIKHFACNNQEDNRKGSNSVISERTLREIYLRGFEIAVKTSQPMAIMTSYNLINGVHAANCKDTCTVAAREEWDFQGIIMTDWTTTAATGGSQSWGCVAAGNDLIMPGEPNDSVNIKEALENGTLDREDLKGCVKRMLKIIYQTLGYEDSVSYGAQFAKMKPYIEVK